MSEKLNVMLFSKILQFLAHETRAANKDLVHFGRNLGQEIEGNRIQSLSQKEWIS